MMLMMQRDKLYQWRISGFVERDREGGEGHNVIVITVDSVKDQKKNKTTTLKNHIRKLF